MKRSAGLKSFLKSPCFHVLLIVLAGIVVYSNTFHSEFHYDDYPEIVRNASLRDPGNFWPPRGNRDIGYLSFALNYRAGGLDTEGYHITNLGIHISNALLVYLLLILTFRTPFFSNNSDRRWEETARFMALFSALIFATHPVQTQAVTYIVQRFASLAAFFYLLSLTAYVISRLSTSRVKRYAFYFICLGSAFLAMKTKEISFTLPAVITVYEFLFFQGSPGRRLLRLGPVLLMMLVIPLNMINPGRPAAGIIAAASQAARVDVRDFNISRFDYLVTEFRVVLTYLKLIVLPRNQMLEYDYPVYSSFMNVNVFASFLSLASITGAGFFCLFLSRRRDSGPEWRKLLRICAFGIFWFFITLSVESSFIPIANVIFEHRVYIAGPGIFIALVSGFAVFFAVKPEARKALTALLLLIVIALSWAAYNRNAVWRTDITLWEDNVRKAPMRVKALYNLGFAYRNAGRFKDAVKEFQLASMLGSNYPFIFFQLAECYEEMGWPDDAVKAYEAAVGVEFNYPEAHLALGNVYLRKGMTDRAISEYRIALSQSPGLREAAEKLILLRK